MLSAYMSSKYSRSKIMTTWIISAHPEDSVPIWRNSWNSKFLEHHVGIFKNSENHFSLEKLKLGEHQGN